MQLQRFVSRLNSLGALFGALLVFGAGIAVFTPVGGMPGDDLDENELEEQIIEEVNAERSAHDLWNLSESQRLRSDASAYSERMAEEEFYSHTTPDGVTFQQRARCEPAGENLNMVIYDQRHNNSYESVWYRSQEELANGVVDEWMQSDAHRQNILSTKFRAQGVGVEVQPDGKVLVTQILC